MQNLVLENRRNVLKFFLFLLRGNINFYLTYFTKSLSHFSTLSKKYELGRQPWCSKTTVEDNMNQGF